MGSQPLLSSCDSPRIPVRIDSCSVDRGWVFSQRNLALHLNIHTTRRQHVPKKQYLHQQKSTDIHQGFAHRSLCRKNASFTAQCRRGDAFTHSRAMLAHVVFLCRCCQPVLLAGFAQSFFLSDDENAGASSESQLRESVDCHSDGLSRAPQPVYWGC